MIVTFGYDIDKEYFVPCIHPSMSHEVWMDFDIDVNVTKEFFVTHFDKLTLGVRFGLPHKSIKEDQIHNIMMLSGIDYAIACKLLSTKKRHAIITSCKKQLRDWMDEKYEFRIPWSHRQSTTLEKLLFDNYRAEFLSIRRSLSVVNTFSV